MASLFSLYFILFYTYLRLASYIVLALDERVMQKLDFSSDILIIKDASAYACVLFPRVLSAEENSARLACVRHAASVRPEPGSNSLIKVETLFRSLRLLITY